MLCPAPYPVLSFGRYVTFGLSEHHLCRWSLRELSIIYMRDTHRESSDFRQHSSCESEVWNVTMETLTISVGDIHGNNDFRTNLLLFAVSVGIVLYFCVG